MSKKKNQEIIFWLDARDYLAKFAYQRDGQTLSRRDADTWVDSIILMLHVWYDLSISIPSGHAFHRFLALFGRCDVCVTARLFRDADQLLVQYWNEDGNGPWSFEEFITSLSTGYRLGEINMIKPLLDNVRLFYRTGDIEVFRSLHTCLAFISRVSLRDYESTDEIVKLIARDKALPDPDRLVAQGLNGIIREWLAGFRVKHFPRHGKGAISGFPRISFFAKYLLLGSDPMLKYVVGKYAPWSLEQVLPSARVDRPFTREAELSLVPKTALTKRTICKEPATLQYFQQAVRRSLYAWFEEHLVDRIDLRDATRNRRYAFEGSISGCYATIDLSAASDSVTWELAKIAFRNTSLLPWMYATRSRTIRVNEGTFKPRMFAPMGSALCFPVESLIFAACCEYAIREETGRRSLPKVYSVYGDDIAIDSRYADRVCDVLTRCGFTVNRSKTFRDVHPASFRESCGGEYVNGYDVRPLRISRRFETLKGISKYRPQMVEALVDIANECYRRGFLSTRRWILHHLRSLPVGLRPGFGTLDGLLLGDPHRIHWAPTRHNAALQRREQLVGSSREQTTVSPRRALMIDENSSQYWEELRHLHWWTLQDREYDWQYDLEDDNLSLIHI